MGHIYTLIRNMEIRDVPPEGIIRKYAVVGALKMDKYLIQLYTYLRDNMEMILFSSYQ